MSKTPDTGRTQSLPEHILARDREGTSTVLHMDNGPYYLGPENEVLLTAMDGIFQETPFSFCHSLVLYGPSGCGKSHFLMGIHHAWQKKHTKKRSLYMTGEEFARTLATTIASKTTDVFKQTFLNASLIVIDDVHLLQDKEAAQSELLVLLDDAKTRKQHILFGSPSIPSRTFFAEDRLVARLVAGLILPVSLPGLATRNLIVRKLAQEKGLVLSQGMVQDIARQISGTVPKFEGFLTQLLLESGHEQIPLSDVRKQIRKFEGGRAPTIDRIAKIVAKQMGQKQGDMKTKSRKSEIVKARGIAMYLARQLTGLSLREIGRYFGNRDHTTVAHQVVQVEKNMVDCVQWRDTVLKIREIIQA